MLTDEEFRAWCQRNKTSSETEAYIQRIRTSQPARKVRSGAFLSQFTRRFGARYITFCLPFQEMVRWDDRQQCDECVMVKIPFVMAV